METALIIILIILVVIFFVLLGIKYFPNVRNWTEKVIFQAVAQAVGKFWEEQNKKIQQAQKENAKKTKLDIEKKNKEIFESAVLVDTSALIDGRVLDIVKAGFLFGTLVIPQAVVNELHLLSDNSDTSKRAKGRKGLDVLKGLKDTKEGLKVIIFKGRVGQKADDELIFIAKKYKARLLSLDFNLLKVAEVGGVKILNINQLVNAVKTNFIPGDSVKVQIVQEGTEKKQGVGYLFDGAMVVVDGARELVGNDVDIKVTRVIQSVAGRMVFGKRVG